MKNDLTAMAAEKALMFLIRYAAQNKGTIAELSRRLGKRTKFKWHRERLELWLHPDRDRRRQPPLGAAMLLIGEGEKLIAEAESKSETTALQMQTPKRGGSRPKRKKASK
jgi:hypothetical protein